MSLRRLFKKWAVLVAPLALVVVSASTARAQFVSADPTPTVASPDEIMSAPGALPAVPAAHACAACGAESCGVGCVPCRKKDCPLKFVINTPQPPKLQFKCVCPKPVCDPCHLDPTGNYGYTPTNWRPWMAPPNYNHFPAPTTTPTPKQLVPARNVDGYPRPLPAAPEDELPLPMPQ